MKQLFNIAVSEPNTVLILVTLQHFLFPLPLHSHMQSHIVSLLLYVSLCAGLSMIVSPTADVSYQSFPPGKLLAFPTPPYLIPCCFPPARVQAMVHACSCVCTRACSRRQAA